MVGAGGVKCEAMKRYFLFPAPCIFSELPEFLNQEAGKGVEWPGQGI